MNNAPILTFDIETIPDTNMLRRYHNASNDISDKELVEMDARLRRQEKGNDFLPPHWHRIVVISCVMRYFDNTDSPLKILSFTDSEQDEAKMVSQFFRTIDKHTPQLVSWNGSGFDLPVLHWRAMKYGITAPRYWQSWGADNYGDKFRWNNYISRYHERHLDIMDVLGLYQSRAKLDEAAQLCGLPGKIGIGGANVWDAWREDKIDDIRCYCEADALLTYLLFIRFQYFRGEEINIAQEYQLVRDSLSSPQWSDFLEQWHDK